MFENFIQSINYIDGIVVVVLLLFVFASYKKGLVMSVFGLVSWLVSLALAAWLYPMASKFMRGTFVFHSIKKSVIETMGLSDMVSDMTLKAQNDLISGLELPDFLKSALLQNNNPEIYKILDVSSIEDYIGGYIANLLIDGISAALVFVIVLILVKAVAMSLDLITKLPVINSMNKLGGALVGLLKGTLVLWLGFAALIMFFAKPEYNDIFVTIDKSLIGKWFFESNVLLDFILKVKP